MENKNDSKKIEVVNGNGELDISPVREHLEVEKPKPKENKTIVIPKSKMNSSKDENSSE